MYIGKEVKKKKIITHQIPKENLHKVEAPEIREEEEQEVRREDEREIVNPNSILHKWRALEHEVIEKDKRWFMIAGLVLAAIVAYAVFTDGIIMAITFILIGTVGYITLNRVPRTINFYITDDGVIADKEIYEFEDIKAFWIFYEVDGLKSISLHLKGKFVPHVHIPLGTEDPAPIRELLMEHLEEVKQELSMVDNIERILRI